MPDELPILDFDKLRPTRDYLQAVAKVLGKLQQAYLPAEDHDWQYGLEVTMRGIVTRSFEVEGRPQRALLDLVRHKVRYMDKTWLLRETPPAQIFKDIETMIGRKLDEPEFTSGTLEFDQSQADNYAAALWWMDEQFRSLRAEIKTDLASRILLYPHHFDLSLAWYPNNDDHQLSIGWSTGDESIAEPYLYTTSYPDYDRLKSVELPPGASWHEDSFQGAVLTYKALREAGSPEDLFINFRRAYLHAR